MHFRVSSAICFNLDQSKILSSADRLTPYHTIARFNNPDKKKSFEKIVEKGDNAGYHCFQMPSFFRGHKKL